MADHKSITEAKLAIMAEVGYCLKTKSAGLNYTYASESELIAALRPAMIENGVTLCPADCELVDSYTYETKRGTTMFVVRIKSRYKLVHDSGTFEEIDVFGEGADMGDKALPKAMTCAYKYAIRQAFMIETGDDPDKFASQPAVSKAEEQKSFEKALQAVVNAESIAQLNNYRKVYTEQRSFPADMVQQLDDAYHKKLKSLAPADDD